MMNVTNTLAALMVAVALGFAGDASAIDGTRLQVNKQNVRFGYYALTSCDLNGDGYDDVVAGAPGYDNGARDTGAVFVFFGGGGSFDDSPDVVLYGKQDGETFGTGVACTDLDGDGYDDVAAGAPGYDGSEIDEGAVYLHYGSIGGPATMADVVLESGQEAANFGSRVAAAGDVNGDGYNDLIVAAINYDTLHTNEGAAFVYFGGSAGVDTVADGMFSHDQWNYQISEVAGVGDLNADGYDDVMVGNWLYNNGISGQTGTVWLFYGGPGAFDNIPDATLTGSQGASIGGRGRIAGGGDLNGDGIDDVALGGPRYPNLYSEPLRNKGAVLLYLGTSGPLGSIWSVRLHGDQLAANFGTSVQIVPDADGDGDDELLVGEPMRDSSLGPNSGRVLYFEGANGSFNLVPDLIFESEQNDSRLGTSVGSGDFNGDGVTDLLMAAPMQDDGEADEGVVFVVLR